MLFFMPRMDTHYITCPTCKGTGTDPKKRKRRCPHCNGYEEIEVCNKCKKKLPCPCDEGKMY